MSWCCRSKFNNFMRWYIFHHRNSSTAQRPPRKKQKSTRLQDAFVDYRKVSVKAGDGGNGCMSFLSLPNKEFAGPDGGDGGNGGHIIFEACTNVKSLASIDSLNFGKSGTRGRGDYRHGKNAEHKTIKIPVGTCFKTETGELLADLDKEGAMFIGARGGCGGKGNHFFLSNENRAPTVYEEGGQGEQHTMHVELRVMAHAGLVGFPNVGKSTLLQAISRAHPKVANYPFTTLRPYVGVIEYPDFQQIAVADLPGLIEGAHQNRGLGIGFLRHIERCMCLLYVVDLSLTNPWTQLDALKYELEQYSEGLSRRPHAVIGNKIDLDGADDNLNELRKRIEMPVFPISAKYKLHIKPLLQHLKQLYDEEMSKQEAVS